MTKRERALIQKAIDFIHADEEDGGDYNKGMDILAYLVNPKRRDLYKGAVKVPYLEVAERAALERNTKDVIDGN